MSFRGLGRLQPACLRWLSWLLFAVPLFALQAGTTGDSIPAAPQIEGTIHSPKKGLGIGTRKIEDWRQRLTRLNVSWFYTWRAQHPDSVPRGVEFVPMVWGARAISEETLAELKNGQQTGSYRNLLGFNEPDARTQANVPVEDAVRSWPRLASTGLRLGSPATVNAHNLWMRAFVAGVEQDGGRLDFVALHWYGGPDSDNFLKHLGYVHKRYGLPIWITEFAVADWEARARGVSRYSPEQALEFMQAVIPTLERLEYVERYAWFSASQDHPALGQSALFDRDGAMTLLGRFYAGY
jgi:hypothetical protein